MPAPRIYPPQGHIVRALLGGDVVVDIGQVSPETVKQFKKLHRAGTLVKWRGYWHPVPGAPWGIGPPKTCWGLASKYAAEQVAA